jgi:hypothetical protein
MPRTKKGTKILRAMRKQYGKERGTRIFYASANAKKITGVHKGRKAR